MLKPVIRRKIFTVKRLNHVRVNNAQTVLNSRITTNKKEEIKPMTEDVSKQEVRVLFKKCLACNFIVPWETGINECADDPECPANNITFVKGRNPEKYIQDMSEKFADALVDGNREEFMDLLKIMVKDKNLRDLVYDVFANSIEKIEEKSLEKSVNEAPI
jgi:hypothetical protein